MDFRVLLRPEVKVKKKTAKEKALPVDLAAAYTSYHKNLVEQRKLEQKLQIIDIETKQMKRNFRQRREVLEKEMKKTESDYWNCHRVFSAETLITESDSYRKCFYTGPQPTKAKLPRRTLERLSQLVRSLQAVDDLETLTRFQRCARYARRKTLADDHESVSSLTLSEEGSDVFDPWEEQHFTEVLNERSVDKAGRLCSNTSIKAKRIRSAPIRVASRTGALGKGKERRSSAGPPQYAPKKLELDISQNLTSCTEKSREMTHSGGREKAPVRFAWTEKEKTDTTVDDAIDTSLSDATVKEPSRDIDLMQASPELETSHSTGHQSRDAIFPLYGISRGSSDSVSSHQDPQRGEASFVHVQSKEAEISEPDHRDSTFSITCQDQADEDFAHILEERDKGREAILSESEVECSFRKHTSSQRNDNEVQHLTQRKRGDRDAELTRNNTRGAALYKNEGKKTKSVTKISVTLPKSSLHGLSSCRKSLTPRTQQKSLQRNHRASMKAEDKREVKNNSDNVHAKMLPHDADKGPGKERQVKDAYKKRRLSIFKRGSLSEALFSEQTQIESKLRNRVQGFLEAIHSVDETSEEGNSEEEFQ